MLTTDDLPLPKSRAFPVPAPIELDWQGPAGSG
jgi:hypothetical protein